MVIVLQTGLRRTDTDMTRGSVLGQLVAFSVPLLIGNIFQQLYNTVDSVVVGNFVGKEALAAVGSVGPVINMLIGFFNGFATGAGVVISRHYGARQRENVRTAVQTTIAMTILMSIALSVLGVVLTPALLRMMQTPEEVLAHASEYLQIYFAGLSGLLLYNMGAGILRAVGDTRRPLYFLIFSAVTNTVLDLLFVAVFHMGVAGVAIATILAQFASAALVLLVLTRSKGDYRIEWRAVRLDKNMLGSICALGLPSAVQLAVTAFSNIFVQSYINRFGADCMAGWTSYNKIDSFALLPITTISLAVTTFVGQNLGAGDHARAKKGTRTALLLSEAVTVVVLLPLMLLSPQLITLAVLTISMGLLLENVTAGAERGLLFAVLSVLTWTFQLLYMERSGILEEEDRQTLTFYICLLMAVVGLIYGALTATLQLRSILTNFGIIALIAFLNNVCATVFLQYGVQYAGAGLCAILSVFEPLGSIVIGAILLHEQLTLRQMLSCVLILGSICFLIVSSARREKAAGRME